MGNMRINQWILPCFQSSQPLLGWVVILRITTLKKTATRGFNCRIQSPWMCNPVFKGFRMGAFPKLFSGKSGRFSTRLSGFPILHFHLVDLSQLRPSTLYEFPSSPVVFSSGPWGASSIGGLWRCHLQHRGHRARLLSRLPCLSAIDFDVCHKVLAKDGDAMAGWNVGYPTAKKRASLAVNGKIRPESLWRSRKNTLWRSCGWFTVVGVDRWMWENDIKPETQIVFTQGYSMWQSQCQKPSISDSPIFMGGVIIPKWELLMLFGEPTIH